MHQPFSLPHPCHVAPFSLPALCACRKERLRIFDRWGRANPAPAAQTTAAGAAPLDYWINIKVNAGAHLCGVEPARLRDFVSLLRLGELNAHVDSVVKPGLATVLERMDQKVGVGMLPPFHTLLAVYRRSTLPALPEHRLHTGTLYRGPHHHTHTLRRIPSLSCS